VSKFLLLAFRNVFRNRRRTFMTLLMVGGGVTGLLLAGGFFAFMISGLREHTIKKASATCRSSMQSTSGATRCASLILASTTGGRWPQPCRPGRTCAELLHASSSTAWSPTARNLLYSWAAAVDPLAETSLGFTPRIAAGRDLDSKTGGDVEALIGSGLAKSMNVKVGDGLTLLAVTSDGALNGVDVQIAGIVENRRYDEMDARYLRITLALCPAPAAKRPRHQPRGRPGSTSNTDAAAAALAPRLQGLPQQMVLKKWIDLATYYLQVRNMFFGIFLFLGIIVFFMVLMSSVNTLLMAMFERTREIGTMLAMGTPRAWIVALFMLEAT
jgi:putative ABC transport system permease protein